MVFIEGCTGTVTVANHGYPRGSTTLVHDHWIPYIPCLTVRLTLSLPLEPTQNTVMKFVVAIYAVCPPVVFI